MKSISLGQYFCSLFLITLFINVITSVSAPWLEAGACKGDDLPKCSALLQRATVSRSSGCELRGQNIIEGIDFSLQKHDKPAQTLPRDHIQRHHQQVLPCQLTAVPGGAWHPAQVHIQGQAEVEAAGDQDQTSRA